MNEWGGDIQQVGCLYKPTSGISEHLSTRGHLPGLRNKPQKKKTNQLLAVVLVSSLMELLIGNEKHSLSLCAYVAGFGKSSHIFIGWITRFSEVIILYHIAGILIVITFVKSIFLYVLLNVGWFNIGIVRVQWDAYNYAPLLSMLKQII